ncbi:FAD-binding oxidoreductase [Patulibacter americanus]|uniref:FAD-binding oxidoreductase n=1 Tax=Patulibacter americanus TaxID=588672 RepID=UPI0003B32E20|nr:FAD-binding oxidoreductase [Patulibacter americanus]
MSDVDTTTATPDDRAAAAAARDLGRIVGEAHVQAPVTQSELLQDATETRGLRGSALAAVHPGSAEETAAVVRWAAEQGVPVVPRGGGTGYSGGAVPGMGPEGANALVLATDRLTGPGEIVPEAWRGTFPAGVTTHDLQRRCLEAGLFFGPNPGSAEACFIGGNVATNAGGPRSFRHGSVRAWVSGLEAVLADGQLVRLGGNARKSVETLDLVGLLCGSEGTLGVITEVTLRLQPAPEAALPVLAVYADREAGLNALAYAMASGVVPTALEFLDGGALRAAAATFPGGLPDGAAFAVMAEALGTEEIARIEADALAEAISEDALRVLRPTTRSEVDEIWRWRDGVSLSVVAARGGKLSEDVVVPADRLGDALSAIDRLGEERGVEVTSWGHAGDGILHATVMVDRDDPEALRAATDAAHGMLDIAFDLGGALSGEHGIGLVKRDATTRLDPGVLAAQQAVKDALDPKGIMNPGRKLPPR